jgi:hypothetical protein
MNNFGTELNHIAIELLKQNGQKPNYSNFDFFGVINIFQTALMDKMFDNQDFDKMEMDDRINMANKCGEDLRKLIHTYTGLDTHNLDDFKK